MDKPIETEPKAEPKAEPSKVLMCYAHAEPSKVLMCYAHAEPSKVLMCYSHTKKCDVETFKYGFIKMGSEQRYMFSKLSDVLPKLIQFQYKIRNLKDVVYQISQGKTAFIHLDIPGVGRSSMMILSREDEETKRASLYEDDEDSLYEDDDASLYD